MIEAPIHLRRAMIGCVRPRQSIRTVPTIQDQLEVINPANQLNMSPTNWIIPFKSDVAIRTVHLHIMAKEDTNQPTIAVTGRMISYQTKIMTLVAHRPIAMVDEMIQ
jgi:hypothetical protein